MTQRLPTSTFEGLATQDPSRGLVRAHDPRHRLLTPTRKTRLPHGYLGHGHMTLGSDILAVLAILKLPDQVLGEVETANLRSVQPDEWYPIRWLLALMESLDEHVGYYGLLRMGRTLFKMTHQERMKATSRSARHVLYGLDGMYRHANKGDRIGGWRVLRFEPGQAEVEKTTPHHCVMEQGLISAALIAAGCPGIVTQRECVRDGADACIFVVTSAFTNERWSGSV